MEILEIVVVILLGMILGSFYACMGYRIPNKINLSKPSSFCDSCKRKLKWYMNIPVFSYVIFNGKCLYCGKKIGFINLFVEVFTSLLFLLFYLKFGFTVNFYLGIILTSVLSVTIVSDFIYYYVSDRTIIIGILFVALIQILSVGFFGSLYYLFSGICMFSLMYLVKLYGDKRYKKESLGGGDIKIMGLIGLSIGLVPSLLSLGLASFFGLIYALIRNKKDIIAFGPFLIFASLLTLYFIDVINIYI